MRRLLRNRTVDTNIARDGADCFAPAQAVNQRCLARAGRAWRESDSQMSLGRHKSAVAFVPTSFVAAVALLIRFAH